MSDRISPRQHQILQRLLENKVGLSIDAVARDLNISRNAVHQHFASLERDGYIQKGDMVKTAGRPVRLFRLTEAGVNSFPKQYAWFSELIIASLKAQMGSEAFQQFLHRLSEPISRDLDFRLQGRQGDERLLELVKIMDELGFQANLTQGPGNDDRAIEACHCIYHDLAQKHEEICQFDRSLISSLLGKKIDHVECMAKGGLVCKFKIRNEDDPDEVG